MEDRRAGLILRALRRRKGWRQRDLAERASVSQSTASRAERGHFGSLSVDVTRGLFAAVDARAELDVRWRGGEVDRLMDEDHAQIAEMVASELQRLGWTYLSEVTFTRYGERGSIDLLAVQPAERIAALFEFKTEITSSEETQRRFDAKRRVLASVVEERFGWRPVRVGTFLVLSDTTKNRQRLVRIQAVLRNTFPASTREVRGWLASPAGSIAGIWFTRLSHRRTDMRGGGGSHRVRPTR